MRGAGGAIDWESIARGMLDGSTAFEVPPGVSLGNIADGYTFLNRRGLSGEITIEEGVTTLGYDLCHNCVALEKVNLPSTLTKINNNVFQDCSSLVSMSIPNSVTTLGNNCFSGCTSLSSVNIPTGVTTLNAYVFQNCKALKTIVIPSGVTSMNASFAGSGIETITIPSGVTNMGTQCFNNCTALAEVIMESTTPPTTDANTFQGCTALTAIYVPDNSVAAYKAASGWSTYASKIKGISERPTT